MKNSTGITKGQRELTLIFSGTAPTSVREREQWRAHAKSHAAKVSHRARKTKLKYTTESVSASHINQLRTGSRVASTLSLMSLTKVSQSAPANYTVDSVEGTQHEALDNRPHQTQLNVEFLRPSGHGLQVINPFASANGHFDRDSYSLLHFYQAWTPKSGACFAVIEFALKHPSCLYPLIAYAAVIWRGLDIGPLPPNHVARASLYAAFSVRQYLNSPNWQSDAAIHGLAYLGLAALFRRHLGETRIHLNAIKTMLGAASIRCLPPYLQLHLVYCDVLSALPSLSRPIFEPLSHKYEAPSLVKSVPSLRCVKEDIETEIKLLRLPSVFDLFSEDVLRYPEIELGLLESDEAGANLPHLYHQILFVAAQCLTYLNSHSFSKTTVLAKRVSLITILWATVLVAADARFVRCNTRLPLTMLHPVFDKRGRSVLEARRLGLG